MGATVKDILRLITWEFTVLVFVASLIAWPLSWFLLTKWMENYAYRAPMPLWFYAVAGLAALLVALVTTGSTALRASNLSPADALRKE